MTKIELNLSDALASELDLAGLLAPGEFEELAREVLLARRLKIADEVLAKRGDSSTAMTTEEIQAEIDAYRAEKRRAAGR